MLSNATPRTRPVKPVAWLGFTVPFGFRLKNRMAEPWQLAKPTSEPPDDITESPLAAVHPPTTVWGALNGRTAAPTAVAASTTTVTAAATTRSDRRNMVPSHPRAVSRPGAARRPAYLTRNLLLESADLHGTESARWATARRSRPPVPAGHGLAPRPRSEPEGNLW